MKPIFLKLNIITSKPGNSKKDIFIRLDTIISYSECDEEFCRIGGSTSVELLHGAGNLITTHSLEELDKLIKDAATEQVKG